MRLVFGDDQKVAEWVGRRIEEYGSFGPCSAIGVADGNRPIAGVVYHMWQPRFRTVQMSVAADSPRWAQRGIIRALLSYPFEQLEARKAWIVVSSGNERCLRFVKGIGFRQEGILSRQFGKHHAVVLRMFDSDYRRLYKEASDGEEGRGSAASA